MECSNLHFLLCILAIREHTMNSTVKRIQMEDIMTTKQRIRIIRLAEKLQSNALYANQIGVAVETKQSDRKQNETKRRSSYD